MFLTISDLENNVQSELHDVESADELNQVISDLDGVDVESIIAGNDEAIDAVNDDDNESSDDESDVETEIEDAA